MSLVCTNCAISNAVLKLGHFLCAKNRVKINESCLKDLSICGPSIKDVSQNFRFLGYPPSPRLLKSMKSTNERLLFGHFLYPPPSPFGETSFMDGPLHESSLSI